MKRQVNTLSKNNKNKCQEGPSTRTGIWRLVTILACLQNGNVEGKAVNCSNLTKYLEVDRSTVMRDLMFLRDSLGVEFEWDASGNNYVMTGECKYFPCLELRFIDKVLFQFIENSLADVADTELGRELLQSYYRLTSIFTGKKPKPNWGVPVSFESKDSKFVAEFKIFNLVLRANAGGNLLKMTWKDSGFDEAVTNTVKPHGIVLKNCRWFLDCQEIVSGKSRQIPLNQVFQIAFVELGVTGLNEESSTLPPSACHLIKPPLANYCPEGDAPLKAA